MANKVEVLGLAARRQGLSSAKRAGSLARVERVMQATGCTAEDAREYLIAEEGDERDAIISYRTDRMEVAK